MRRKSNSNNGGCMSNAAPPRVVIEWPRGLHYPAVIYPMTGDPDRDEAIRRSLEPFVASWKRRAA
jgi:hypothetical protein